PRWPTAPAGRCRSSASAARGRASISDRAEPRARLAEARGVVMGARMTSGPPGRPPSTGSAPWAEGVAWLPIIRLRAFVLVPISVVPISVGRRRSVRLVEDLLGKERAVVGVPSQRSPDVDEPTFRELYEVGTLARVVKVIRLGANNYSVVLNGLG